MEIIVGTFFIIFLIVFLCKEGLKEFSGTGVSLIVVLGIDIIAVGVLFSALGNMAEENGWWVLDILCILLIVPAMFGVFLVAILLGFFDLVMPYELHRSTRLSTRARELSADVDTDWYHEKKPKANQKYGWLK